MYTSAFKAKGLEIIFVSSDRDEEAFKDYFGSQPWLSLPFADRDRKNKLSKKFKVSGIPSLVILDGATGATITTDGREAVMNDPTGKDLPWKPPTFWEALGTEFLSGTEGDTVEVDDIRGAGKYIGLYFSAHWCPPCRGFTPTLVQAYKEHLKAKNLEIIFVSSDRDQASFKEYFDEMPWLAIPQGDKRKEKLSSMFGVEGIPSFVMVDAETGETVNGNCRGKVSSDPTGAEFPWRPKALNNIDDGPDGINEEVTLCLMMEGCSAEVKAECKAALEPIAEATKASKKEDGAALFFYAASSGGIGDKIRQLTKLGAPTETPQLVLLDIPDDGGFYVSSATECTKETIVDFLGKYSTGGLERKQLG